jgi:YHS domain-containing protein
MLVRLLLIAIFGFLVYTLFSAIKRSLQKPPAPPAEKSARGEEMVQDPHCGTYVPRSDSLSSQIKGKRYYFCSERCRDLHTQER